MKRTSVYGLFRAFIVTCLLALPTTVSANVVKLTSGEWQPYISKSLKEGGFVTQLVKEAFESQGYTVEFVYMPWKRSFEEAKSGLYDGSIVWSKTDEREEHFLYSHPIVVLKDAIFQRKDKPIRWSSRSDLTQYTIGGVLGYSYGLDDLESDNGWKIRRVASPESNYQKLAAGRLDGVLEDLNVGKQTINEMELGGQLEPAEQILSEREYHVIISKASPRAQELLEVLNKGLKQLVDEGKADQYLEATLRGEYQ